MANSDKVFRGQSSLKIRLDTEIDLSNAATMKIKYKRPDYTGDSWVAYGDTTYPTRIAYELTGDTEIDASGNWIFWSHITFTDGRVAMGKPVQKWFDLEGM